MDSAAYLNEKPEYTILTKDYPEEYEKGKNEPIYPKPFNGGTEIYDKYKTAASAEKNVIFLGRLATYKYLDMWMAIKQVMTKLK